MDWRNRCIYLGGTVLRWLNAHGLLREPASGLIRKLSRATNHGEVAYHNEWGHLLRADLSDYMERIGFFGAHSPRLIRYVKANLRKGDWAIDAGANVGLFSSPMAAIVGPSGCVWAIEPLPRNVERLDQLKQANTLSQLKIFPVALGARESVEELRLASGPGGSGFASFVAPWAGQGGVGVRAVSLDSLVDAQAPNMPLRLIKIDVEGFEAQVLLGAKETLATYRPVIICEFHDLLLRAAGSSSEELLATFLALGYVPRIPLGRSRPPLDGKITDMLLVPDRIG